MAGSNHEDTENQGQEKRSLASRILNRKPAPSTPPSNGGDGLTSDQRARRASEIEDLLGIPRGANRMQTMTNAQVKALNHVVTPPPGKLGEVSILTARQACLFSIVSMYNAAVAGYEGDLMDYWMNKYYELSRAVDGAMFVSSFRQAAIQSEEEAMKQQLRSPIGGL